MGGFTSIMSQLILEERGNRYYRLSNENKERFFIFTHEPASFWKLVCHGRYATCEEADLELIETIIDQSNNWTLLRSFWIDNQDKFPVILQEYLVNNLRFRIIDKGYQNLNAILRFGSRTKYTHISDGGFQYSPLMDYPSLSDLSSIDSSSSDLSTSFDFGGGDSGGGGAGGDY